MTTKVCTKLTLKDILSRLNFTQACKLLGDDGKRLIKGGAQWDVKIPEDVSPTGRPSINWRRPWHSYWWRGRERNETRKLQIVN